MKHDQQLEWLDLVRGISAIAVCANHLRSATLVDYGNLPDFALHLKAFYFLTGLGHQAVMVFFVLSGFFVGGSILRNGEHFRLADYVIARLTRLWVVLLPALVMTAIINGVLASTAPGVLNGSYQEVWHSGPVAGDYSASLPTFIGNLFFLQTIVTPVFGVNLPLWSLANEFWYYATFPLLAFILGVTGSSRRLSRGIGGMVFMLIMFFLPEQIGSGFLVWLMGVAVYVICGQMRRVRRPFALIITFLLFVGSLAYSKSGSLQSAFHVPSDLVVGLGFSAFCIVIAMWPVSGTSRIEPVIRKVSSGISNFSYSLYLSHFPLVILLATFAYKGSKVIPDMQNLSIFCGELGLLLICGFLFWYVFERHTGSIRTWANKSLLRFSSRST